MRFFDDLGENERESLEKYHDQFREDPHSEQSGDNMPRF
jgi:hypothetical protein